VILDPVTNRWADALFEVARKADALEAIQADTARLSAEVASPKVAAFLYGSSVPQDERIKRVQPLLEQMHPKTQSFVKLLFERRR